jgi:hypothetical protein
LREAKPAVPDIEKTQKVALAAVESARPASKAGPAAPAAAPAPEAAPQSKPAEAFEFKIELPPEFNTPPSDAPKAKKA